MTDSSRHSIAPASRPSIGLQLPSQLDLSELSSELKNSLPTGTLNDADVAYLQDASAFLMRLGRVLHAQGTSAMRLEEALGGCAARLGLRAQLFSTPTSLFIAVGDDRVAQTHMVRVEPGEVNLSRLVELDALIDSIGKGNVSLRQGFEHLDLVASAPHPYPAWLAPVAFGVSSAGAACFFRGNALDVAFSAALGLCLGALTLWMDRAAATRRIYPALASCLAAALALALGHYLPLSPSVITVSALIVLVPGLTLTVAMSELATAHLMSGTARFAAALVTFLQMGLGVGLGRELVQRLLGPTTLPARSAELPAVVEFVALAVTPLAFGVLFRARRRDIPLIALTSVLGFLGARAGAHLLGPELGAFAGAFVVAGISNWLARQLKRPASITLVPGIMLLVPGSIGFRSLNSFLERDVLTGTEGVFRMFLVAATLVGGLLMANAVLPPRREL
ncbi:MAG: threonine/serine exporter family protein [Myxococcales bacterium]|nr:threonine/serine exporter family protein [Myxococcales bacterium]